MTLLGWLARVFRRAPASAAVTAPDPTPPPLAWDESWNPETARLAYEHSREVYRLVDDATEVLNRKVVAVFATASAIATVGPVLGKFPLWSDGWWLSVGAEIGRASCRERGENEVA